MDGLFRSALRSGFRDSDVALQSRAFMIAGSCERRSMGEIAALWPRAFVSQWLRCSSNQALQATRVGAFSSAIAVVAFWSRVPELGR